MTFKTGDTVVLIESINKSNKGIIGKVVSTREGRTVINITKMPENYDPRATHFRVGERLSSRADKFKLYDGIQFDQIEQGDKIKTVLTTKSGTERTQVATVTDVGYSRAEDDEGLAIAFGCLSGTPWDTQSITLLDRPVPKFDAAKYGTGTVVTIDAVEGTAVKVYAATWTLVDGATATFYTDAELAALGANRDAFTVIHAK